MGDSGKEQPAAESPSDTLSPSAEFPPLSGPELDALRQLGHRWWTALGSQRRARLRDLPLDPTLRRYERPPAPSRFGRLTPIELFERRPDDEVVATERASLPASVPGRVATRIRRLVLGPPLASAALLQERMRKLVALPVLASDLLSSVAYGPEAMMTILVLAGSAALPLSLPIAAALVLLMVAVGLSYRQTVQAYPQGAGSYLVASDNLGQRLGLTAAAGLILDYVLTVAVSVAAGVQAVTSAVPVLAPLTVPLGLGVIALLLAGNLRGVRVAANLFAVPTYLFIVALGALILTGFGQAAARGFEPVPPPQVAATSGLGLLLVLRAFSSGAASMTGVEAVANAVPAFRHPQWRNARTVLTWMVTLLVLMFAGLVLLLYLSGLVPDPRETMLSQLARRTFPSGPWYGLIQAATAMILLLAANTAFNDFPRLLFFMARAGHAPRRFLHMGDRLAFSNGLVALAGTAALLFTVFNGHTGSLIPLYAVGVFLAFTLSQAGMVVHWRRVRGPGWRSRCGLNAFGAVLTALVMCTAAVTKFASGAWVVVLAVPVLIAIASRIRRHYDNLREGLALRQGLARRPGPPPRPVSLDAAARLASLHQEETEESPQEIQHLLVVPVVRVNLAALRALAYAASLGPPVLAVHVSPTEDEADRFREQWDAWGDHLRLEIVVSPYRAVIPPLAHYLETLHALRPEIVLTVILPEIVVRHRWHRLLHTGTERRLRQALRELPGIVVTSVPVHLPG